MSVAVLNPNELSEAETPEENFARGFVSEMGIDAPIDYPQAVEWYTRAVAMGHLRAHTRLGDLLTSGEGNVRADFPRALRLYSRAAESGDELAVIRRETMLQILEDTRDKTDDEEQISSQRLVGEQHGRQMNLMAACPEKETA